MQRSIPEFVAYTRTKYTISQLEMLMVPTIHSIKFRVMDVTWNVLRTRYTIRLGFRFFSFLFSLLFITLIVFIESDPWSERAIANMPAKRNPNIHTLEGIQSFHATHVHGWNGMREWADKAKEMEVKTIKLDNYISQSNSISLR